MRILYLFPTPRGTTIRKVSSGQAPDTILYGYNHLQKMGFQVDYLDLPLGKLNIFFLLLFPIEEIFFWLRGINFQLYRLIPKLKEINKYDLVITCSEPLGLPLALLKKVGLFKGKQVYMSLDFVSRFKNERNSLIQKFFKWVLEAPEAIVCYSEIEKQYFNKTFRVKNNKLHFIPAGGDPSFFKPKKQERKFILSVGKDRSRDFLTLFEAIKGLKEKLIVVTGSRAKLPDPSPNVKILKEIPFAHLKKLYKNAKMLVLPLYEQDRASGQMVLLDGMLSGLPVVVSKVLGITSAYDFVDKEHCFFVTPSNSKKLKQAIEFVVSHESIARQIGFNARKIVASKYSTKHFAKKLEKVLKNVQSSSR